MSGFRNVWKKVDAVVFTLVKYACVIILAALVAVVFSIFFGRYVINKSPIWGEPFSLLCLVWMSLLGSADSSFLTDDDFKFHSRENAEMTINRMQEIASSDGLVDVRERDIIERLRFTY